MINSRGKRETCLAAPRIRTPQREGRIDDDGGVGPARVESLSEWKIKARRREGVTGPGGARPISEKDMDRLTREQKCAAVLKFVLADSTTDRQIDAMLSVILDLARGTKP
ncbi:MAG TPA: hypothetical protein VI756_32700 [Blastocatellia bacterium]